MQKKLLLEENYLNHLITAKKYQSIWDNEVLNTYPQSLECYPLEWISLLEQLDHQQLHKIDALIDFSSIKGSDFYELCHLLLKLSEMPKAETQSHNLPISAFDKMNDKKEYEVGILGPIISNLSKEYGLTQVIDIGSGVGNLARLLANQYNLNVLCLEKEGFFHSQGQKYIEKFSAKEKKDNIQFRNLELSNWNTETLSHIDPETLVVGLHACGNLSNRILELGSLKAPKIIFNFACCYLHMKNEDLNMSSFSKNHPFSIGLHGLTMAARFRSHFSFEEYLLKYKVKSYRYALHLFYYYELGIKNFISVGDSKPKDYDQGFAYYAKKKIAKLKLEKTFSDDELNHFFNDKDRQKLLHQMFLCNIIRWQFGRVLENIILLDRAIYLSEQNYNVTIKTYFDEKQSPRNRGILGIRKD